MCGDSQPGGQVQASPDSLPRSQPGGSSKKLAALHSNKKARASQSLPLPVPEHFALRAKRSKGCTPPRRTPRCCSPQTPAPRAP